jgi:hypothetical protein
LALFTYGPNEYPVLVAHTVGKKGEMIWYSGYGQVPFDPKLFAKPEGIAIAEASR